MNITAIYRPFLSFEKAIYLDGNISNNIAHAAVFVKLSVETPICAPSPFYPSGWAKNALYPENALIGTIWTPLFMILRDFPRCQMFGRLSTRI